MRQVNLMALATVLLTWLSGCATPTPEAEVCRIEPGTPILFLPVLPAHPDLGPAAGQLTQTVYHELTARFGARVVPAAALTALSDALTVSNLRRDGQLATAEIAALAQASGCARALLVELTAADAYAPQRLTCVISLLDVKTPPRSNQQVLVLDLADHGTLARYTAYLKTTRAFRVGNLESDSEDRIHTALLAPAVFRRFAAHIIALSIDSGMDLATTGRGEHGSGRPAGFSGI